MPDMPYMERVGRKFVSDMNEVLDGLARIDLLSSVAKSANREKAAKYLKLYTEQNLPPKNMEEWRVLRDGMIKRLRG
ncbi:hypothetical protein SEA_TOMAS_212 [Streptomyces phage Tomas]|uniref:Uncharacterized protein n=1 Tax=Streptomyces phage Tomas TaxID=2914443 RepID=A0AA49BV18_9CAUD|nr:hypothetical protein PP453_gp108 [Streptomyces phage Tomas]UMO76359.1 hypothetical protein SEA_TOMAS_212 [Streptomyces phage Tomas]